jgi:hypothetical protein
MYNNRRQITESELRNVIRDIIAEEIQYGNLDEGLFGGIQTLFNRGKNNVQQQSQNFGGNFQNKLDGAKEYMNKKYQQVKGNVKNAYEQGKKTYQAGSINQDLQKYVNNVETALNNLKTANQRALNSGFRSLLDKNTLPLIDNLLQRLNTIRGAGKGINTSMQNADLQR